MDRLKKSLVASLGKFTGRDAWYLYPNNQGKPVKVPMLRFSAVPRRRDGLEEDAFTRVDIIYRYVGHAFGAARRRRKVIWKSSQFITLLTLFVYKFVPQFGRSR
jgi:hypothetical protein